MPQFSSLDFQQQEIPSAACDCGNFGLTPFHVEGKVIYQVILARANRWNYFEWNEMETYPPIVLWALDGDPLVELKAHLLNGLGYAATADAPRCSTIPLAYCVAKDSKVSDKSKDQPFLGNDLLVAARVLNLDAEESRRVVAALHHREDPIRSVFNQVISPRNELAAIDMIRRTLLADSTALKTCNSGDTFRSGETLHLFSETVSQQRLLEPLIGAADGLGHLADAGSTDVRVQALLPAEGVSLENYDKHIAYSARFWKTITNSKTSAVMNLSYGIRIDEGIGCAIASKEIKAGDLILSLPESMLISVHLARESIFWQNIEDMLNSLSPSLSAATLQSFSDHLDVDTRLLLWSIDQAKSRNNNNSCDPLWLHEFWQSLPQGHLCTGLTIANEVLQGCGDEELQTEIQAYRDMVLEQFNSIATAFKAVDSEFCKRFEDIFTLENFIWAVEIWAAYAVKVVKANKNSSADDSNNSPTESMMCLVPGLHWCNHAVWPHAVSFSTIEKGSNSLTVTAVRGVAKGGEFSIGYGALSNRELLKYYGFAIHNNPYDTLEIDLEADPEAQQLLNEFEVSSRGILDSTGDLPPDLVAAVRIVCLDDPRKFLLETNAPKSSLKNINIRFLFDGDALAMLLDHLYLVQLSIPTLDSTLHVHKSAQYFDVYLEGQRSLVGKAISKLNNVLSHINNDKNKFEVNPNQAADASSS